MFISRSTAAWSGGGGIWLWLDLRLIKRKAGASTRLLGEECGLGKGEGIEQRLAWAIREKTLQTEGEQGQTSRDTLRT